MIILIDGEDSDWEQKHQRMILWIHYHIIPIGTNRKNTRHRNSKSSTHLRNGGWCILLRSCSLRLGIESHRCMPSQEHFSGSGQNPRKWYPRIVPNRHKNPIRMHSSQRTQLHPTSWPHLWPNPDPVSSIYCGWVFLRFSGGMIEYPPLRPKHRKWALQRCFIAILMPNWVRASSWSSSGFEMQIFQTHE